MSEASPDAVLDYLVGLYPHKTAECIEADTGVPAATVRKWLSRGSSPNYAAFVRLIKTYGLDLLNAAIGGDVEHLTAAARAKQRAALKAEHDRIGAAIERLESRA